MTPRYEIVPCQAWHLGALAVLARPDDRREMLAVALPPLALLEQLWSDSWVSRTGFVDGDLAACWGCGGSALATSGSVWLFTTPAVERVPLAFAREARAFCDEMLETKHRLVSACLDGYERSVRLWTMLGFSIEAPMAMGPNGAMFRPMWMERPDGV